MDGVPANYAHYRFGVEMRKLMPGDIRRTVDRFRRLYDMGLHGPDIFFYYNPLYQTKIRELGRRFHKQSGRDFFSRACRGIRLEPSQAAEAYLYGLLIHYCLDSVCHPYVLEQDGQGLAIHAEIEAEFDRFLLEKDGKSPACAQDLSPHMQLTAGECETAAKLYSGVKAEHIQTAVRNMARITKLLAIPEGTRRSILGKGMGLVSGTYTSIMVPTRENPRCGHMNEELMTLYEKAKERFPELLLQISAHLTYNAPLGEEFSANFG